LPVVLGVRSGKTGVVQVVEDKKQREKKGPKMPGWLEVVGQKGEEETPVKGVKNAKLKKVTIYILGITSERKELPLRAKR